MKHLKRFYKVREIAEQCNVTTTTIRDWEKYFHIKVKRDKNDNRQYTRGQKEIFKLIAKELNTGYYTLKGIKELILVPEVINSKLSTNRLKEKLPKWKD